MNQLVAYLFDLVYQHCLLLKLYVLIQNPYMEHFYLYYFHKAYKTNSILYQTLDIYYLIYNNYLTLLLLNVRYLKQDSMMTLNNII